jgi:hypothetical protein
MRKYKYLVLYGSDKKPYFVTVYNKKELSLIKKMLKKGEYYKIHNSEPFIGW